MMSKTDPGGNLAALTPTPNTTGNEGEYRSGGPRIIIWGNGQVTWGSGGVIFSEELITHEFGHVISNAWNPSGRSLASAFGAYFVGLVPDFDFAALTPVWESFPTGSPNTDDLRAFGRFYDTRYVFEGTTDRDDGEVMPEAYAVWVHGFYKDGSGSDYITNQNRLQQRFWRLVFSRRIRTNMTDEEISALREGDY
jgi:hypothetical protein